MTVCPAFALFVVMAITPVPPLTPNMASEEGSFNTDNRFYIIRIDEIYIIAENTIHHIERMNLANTHRTPYAHIRCRARRSIIYNI